MQILAPSCSASAVVSIESPLRVAPEVPFVVAAVECLRAAVWMGTPDILAAVDIKFALRTVPVRVRSACLKFWA